MTQIIDFILHIDKHLADILLQYGTWIYVILFLIIFAETGFVVTPFLPGDSLLFAAGAMAAIGSMNYFLLLALMITAALLGNFVNYAIGYFAGDKILAKGWIKTKYLEDTQKYFDKYGALTIVLSRFAPIIRTIAPFVAGVGKMEYKKFSFYNIIGGISWVGICLSAGYFLGGFEVVKKNFSLITLAIIGVSAIPAVFGFLKAYRNTAEK
jgi:membrane-associated protein